MFKILFLFSIISICHVYGWSDVGYNDDSITTPNIDSLAENGVILNKTYTYSTCTPSRAAMLTGNYVENMGLQYNQLGALMGVGLPTTYKLLPEYLQDYGYKTHAIGKWHLGFCKTDYIPTSRGFDTFYGYFNGETDFYTHRTSANSTLDGMDLWYHDGSTLSAVTSENNTHSMDIFRDRALEVIESHDSSDPFFIYFAPQNAHADFSAPTSYKTTYYSSIKNSKRQSYLSLITQLDDAIGDIIDKLDELGYTDDTIIAFSSDNGGPVNTGKNYPLRGAKDTAWEGGHRVRAFIYDTSITSYVNEGMFHAIDWLPTLLNAAVDSDDEIEIDDIDGTNHWNEISSQEDTTRDGFIYTINPYGEGGTPYIVTEAIRSGDYKLIVGCPGIYLERYPVANTAALKTTKDYTYCNAADNSSSTRTGSVFLYNLEDDPYEETNLASTETEILAEMYEELAAYKTSTVTPILTPTIKSNTAGLPIYWSDTWSPGWC